MICLCVDSQKLHIVVLDTETTHCSSHLLARRIPRTEKMNHGLFFQEIRNFFYQNNKNDSINKPQKQKQKRKKKKKKKKEKMKNIRETYNNFLCDAKMHFFFFLHHQSVCGVFEGSVEGLFICDEFGVVMLQRWRLHSSRQMSRTSKRVLQKQKP